MKRVIAYIALGSNMGNKGQTLRDALDMMRRTDGITLKRVSSFMDTQPVGGPADQPAYLNGVAEIDTSLTPQELLAALQSIEASLGRDRSHELRWGPRTCDLDIIYYDDEVLDTPELTIPHPRMHERVFVLAPLESIAPQIRHPLNFMTPGEMLQKLEMEGGN
jgi:2-amino-4-hydroxy-6-hydroxymethyldihydropteridine diphosphokinase